MKELSMEEKAKRYDEAIKKAKEMIKAMTNIGGVAKVDDIQYLFPELKESEDDKIRQFLIREIEGTSDEIMSYRNMNKKDVLIWLEKQGEHANFRNKIQIGDKVTRNKDGVLVNLSQLNRVAKKDEKQGEQKIAECNNSILKDKLLELFQRFRWHCKDETPTNGDIIDYVDAHIQELIDTIQKPTDKVEPKFKVGDWVTIKE